MVELPLSVTPSIVISPPELVLSWRLASWGTVTVKSTEPCPLSCTLVVIVLPSLLECHLYIIRIARIAQKTRVLCVLYSDSVRISACLNSDGTAITVYHNGGWRAAADFKDMRTLYNGLLLDIERGLNLLSPNLKAEPKPPPIKLIIMNARMTQNQMPRPPLRYGPCLYCPLTGCCGVTPA